jgi:LysM repeat protein
MRMAHPVRARARRRRLAGAALFELAAAAVSLGVVAGRAPSPPSTPPPEAFQPFAASRGLGGLPSTAQAPGPAASGLVPALPLVPTVPVVPTIASVAGASASSPPGSFVPESTTPASTSPLTPATSPPPATTESPAATAPAGPSHVVRAGDSLWSIAAMHDVSLSTVVRWNPAANPASLRIGSTLLVPGGRAMTLPPAATPRPDPTPRTLPRPRLRTHRWPLAIRGTITTTFSSRHPGIDIAAPAGTSVRAIAAGVVAWAGWKDNGGGFVVVVRHPDGMVSTYNHNRRVLVAVGQRVLGGERIAEVGATGNATGPHLDVRIEMGGRYVNPLSLY